VMQTAIALVQELWFLNNTIKGLSDCGTIFKPNTQNKIRTCIAVKGLNAIFMSQLSNGNNTVVQLRLNLAGGGHRYVLVGSCPTTPRTCHPLRKLRNWWRGRFELLLGCELGVGEHRHQSERGEPPRLHHGGQSDHPEQRIGIYLHGL